MQRRSFITGIMAGCALGMLGLPALAGLPDPSRAGSQLDQLISSIPPVLDLRNTNTREILRVRFFNASGYDMDGVNALFRFMRDWRQDEVRPIDVRLFWALAAIRTSAMKDGHDGQIHFHSGFRSPATNALLRRMGVRAARDSLHIQARAADFSMAGVPTHQIAALSRWLEVGGTGHYPGRFVHIDSGRLRSW